jgi:hypothetical protein
MAPFGKVNVSPGKQETCILDAPPTDFSGVQPRRRRQKITVRRQPENFGLRTSEQFPAPKTPFRNPVRSATNGFAWHARPRVKAKKMSYMAPFGKVNVSLGKQETCILDAPPTDFAGVQPKRRRQKFTVRRQPEDFGLRTSEQFPAPKTPFRDPVRSATNGFAWHAKINSPTPSLDIRQITKKLLNRKFRTEIGKGTYRGRELPEPLRQKNVVHGPVR